MFLVTASAHWGVRRPDLVRMVPPVFQDPELLVTVTGVAEIAGGLATLHPATRRAGSLWSIATLMAVFPANVHMALNTDLYSEFSPTAQWVRLPVQGVLLAWAYWFTGKK